MRRGNRRLLLLEVPSGARAVASRLPVNAKLAMSRHPYASAAALLDDCAACAADEIIASAGGPAWDAGVVRGAAGVGQVVPAGRDGRGGQRGGQGSHRGARGGVELEEARSPAFAPAVADMRAQLAGLIYPGFVAQTGVRRLPDLVRYLRAIAHRLDKAAADIGRDADRMEVVHRVSDDYEQVQAELGPAARGRADVAAVRWMIEELRVSLFAQPVGAAIPGFRAADPRRARPALGGAGSRAGAASDSPRRARRVGSNGTGKPVIMKK